MKAFDPTVRCQNCGDTLKNHGPKKACKGRSVKGKTWTPWTREAYAQAEAQGREATKEAS